MGGNTDDRDPSPTGADRDPADSGAVDAFIARWRDATGTERANYQLFLT